MKHKYLNYKPNTQNFQKKLLITIGVCVSVLTLLFATRPRDFEIFAASPSLAPKASPVPSPRASVKPTASPSPVASPSAEAATESLKDRIDRILEQRVDKLKDLEQSGQKRRAFVGEVQRITERTVTLHTRRGNQSFTVGSDVILLKNGKAATIDDIAVGDWLCVIGFLEKETIQPQIAIISTTTLQPDQPDTIIGTIKSISRTQIVITDVANSERTFQIVKTTLFETVDGETSKRENLETETQVIVVSEPEGSQNPALMIRSLAGKR